MTITDLITWFEGWANPAWQEKWDNCGWQIEPGILHQPAQVLVCLTPTLAVMEEAIALRAQGQPINLIFAHHPLIFTPLKAVRSGDEIGEMIQLAITHQIGVYSAHTNLDQVNHGTADVLAELLALKQAIPIVPTYDSYGYGRVGNLVSPLPLAELLQTIRHQLQTPHLLYSPRVDLQHRVERVAVLGGSGASFLGAVAETGAQVYLTADCKFHQFQEARDRGLVLVDAGHYATERPACQRLVEKFWAIGATWVQLSQSDEDFRQFF